MREKPTLLLLHGAGGDHSFWKPAFGTLSEVAQVVYLDHRNQGRSDASGPERWSYEAWGDDVRAFCEALEIEKPIVMGSALGATIAIAYATRHPDHPGRLILCSASAQWRQDRILNALERLGGKKAREAAERHFQNPDDRTLAEYARQCFPLFNRKPIPAERGSRTVSNMEPFSSAASHLTSYDFLPALARIRCPTLILGAEDDPAPTIEDSEDIVAALPRHLVRFERFPNCGHGILNDSPDELIRAAREFIGA